jgi:protein-disulfide isomerase
MFTSSMMERVLTDFPSNSPFQVNSSAQNSSAIAFHRRAVLTGVGAFLAAGAAGLSLAGAPAFAAKDEVPVDKLMADNGLPVLEYGNKDAKVTIVEYASLTCPACANFHTAIFPKLKEKYIDTGKVRLVVREFPFDQFSAAVSMLARCPGGDKVLPFMSVLFKTQDVWRVQYPVDKLKEISKQAGITAEGFEKCLNDDELLKKLIKQRDTAADEFGVKGTPTFFINGKKLNGGYGIENFDKVLEPLLKG